MYFKHLRTQMKHFHSNPSEKNNSIESPKELYLGELYLGELYLGEVYCGVILGSYTWGVSLFTSDTKPELELYLM